MIRLFGLIPDLEKEVIPETGYSIEEIEQKMKTGKIPGESTLVFFGERYSGTRKTYCCERERTITRDIETAGVCYVGKKIDKVLDFAMEFCAGRQGVEFIGWSVFSTGLNGEYRGNYLELKRILSNYWEVN